MEARIEPGGGRSNVLPRVLVLDSDPRISEALSLALRRVARVERAARGMAGLILTAEEQVNVVIAQADLPDVFTSELVRLLRVLRPHLPIAVLGERQAPLAWPDEELVERFPSAFDLRRCVSWITRCIARPPGLERNEMGPCAAEIPFQHAEIVRWVLAFVERRHRDGTRLAIIARMAGVSRSHLCRIFRRVTGESLKRFLTRRRLEESKRLLRNPALTIQQVAAAVGYRELSHFDRVFRRWEGQSPSQYRYRLLTKPVRSLGGAEISRPRGSANLLVL